MNETVSHILIDNALKSLDTRCDIRRDDWLMPLIDNVHRFMNLAQGLDAPSQSEQEEVDAIAFENRKLY
jgi:hypothetical protein